MYNINLKEYTNTYIVIVTVTVIHMLICIEELLNILRG
jgi:hypothetical protein